MRITPTLAFSLIVYLSVYELIPQRFPYAFDKDLIEPCEKVWWAAVLHVQNLVNPATTVRSPTETSKNSDDFLSFQCIAWTWQLDVDWQMFVVAPLIVYPALKIGRKFLMLLLAALVAVSTWKAYKISMQHQFTLGRIVA
jgi:peptidoglycan/LPS O-acetylase OafA/YrhL